MYDSSYTLFLKNMELEWLSEGRMRVRLGSYESLWDDGAVLCPYYGYGYKIYICAEFRSQFYFMLK
jgi:hypothetical protein